MDIKEIRKKFKAIHNYIYFNFGAGGPLADPVVEKISEIIKMENVLGPYHFDLKERREKFFGDLRGRIADFLEADEEEIALTDNTTDGINIIVRCFDWQKGDEVIICDAEHPGGYLPFLNIAEIRGVKVKVIPLKFDEHSILDTLSEQITEKTKLICLSHVAWCTGYRIPVKAIAAVAKSHRIHFVIDGAQSVGQIAVNVKDIGCDSYTVSGHKWLMGPMGTGALYVNKESASKLSYLSAGYRSAFSFNLGRLEFIPHVGAKKFEISTRSYALFAGLAEAIDFLSSLGIEKIEARILDLATRLQRKLADIPGVIVNSPFKAPGNQAYSGLVSFKLLGIEEDSLLKILFGEYKIIARKVPSPPGIRVSIHFFNTEEEIDFLVNAIQKVSRDRRRN